MPVATHTPHPTASSLRFVNAPDEPVTQAVLFASAPADTLSSGDNANPLTLIALIARRVVLTAPSNVAVMLPPWATAAAFENRAIQMRLADPFSVASITYPAFPAESVRDARLLSVPSRSIPTRIVFPCGDAADSVRAIVVALVMDELFPRYVGARIATSR